MGLMRRALASTKRSTAGWPLASERSISEKHPSGFPRLTQLIAASQAPPGEANISALSRSRLIAKLIEQPSLSSHSNLIQMLAVLNDALSHACRHESHSWQTAARPPTHSRAPPTILTNSSVDGYAFTHMQPSDPPRSTLIPMHGRAASAHGMPSPAVPSKRHLALEERTPH